MPTYTYECAACHEQQEHWLSISARKSEMPCECGGTASQVFNWEGQTIVRGAERPWKLDETCLPIGWDKGNTAEAQEARYTEIVNDTAKRARQVDKQAIKGGIRHIARVPREVVRLRQNQYGKEYLDPAAQSVDSIKQKLKSDGLLFKN